ncbi:DUF3800 domain-containing protein [Lactiplantibacillus plantarum]|uniref:DUF3800 domain-containing protein n=1 Tax=Lactiplantibacillus plantarum TaxID=1590 RepID=UPI0021A8D6C9|nr:DUF3800 domain-containing protein [Lactiplantibacillus plantarum]MCT3223594.1 DUF3800 domain-containing protein [Lactiplantibacillus plantarum]
MDWTKTRSHIKSSNLENVDYLISIDETGIPSLKNINSSSPDHLRWFTISGCIFDKNDINNIAGAVTELKNKYWENGFYHNHRIYLHSRDIRRHQGPFHLEKSIYMNFRKDLDSTIQQSPLRICSATINKLDHINQYLYPEPVYQLALEFMLERITIFLSKNNSTGIIMLECRGWREDNELLGQLVNLLNSGTRYMKPGDFSCIQGVYFEHKLTHNGEKSYWPFELSDIICYRINHYITTGIESDNFHIIKKKIMGYPNHIHGRGIKTFP